MSLEILRNFKIINTEVLKVRSGICNLNGDKFITVFARYKNQRTSGITTFTLFPRDLAKGGYMFELSSQIGCLVDCNFCGVPWFERSLKEREILEQIAILIKEAKRLDCEIREPIKFSFTDGGDLLSSSECLYILLALSNYGPADFKISSVLQNMRLVKNNIKALLSFAKTFNKEMSTHLQISMFSTNEEIRQASTRCTLMTTEQIAIIGKKWLKVTSRKPTLTFTLTNNSHCKASEIVKILSPDLFRVRLFPYKPNGIKDIRTINSEKLEEIDFGFKQAGYELVPCQTDSIEKNNGLLLSGTLTFDQQS